MRSLYLVPAALPRRVARAPRSAVDQRLMDVALCLSRQSIRPAPPRRG